ncbi:hypothetical protein HNQ60_002229 [Povalibacter uvarum]|uniref:DUF2007 domain-containing protein n=1 Tax=Povalibacter uvarum TaxID=732238 RepID=A0A841HJF6_9GAMM|nr:DUF2007 domain-containing protein [Povalibacter uvarum]MBB6093351.1 hypothetical protein [Povalibacter uvarum]
MKRIYQAANNIEAHMLVHLLEQEGIQAHVEGEHLQSGAGELPLGGLAAVAVADEDVDAARAIIRDWEARTAEKPEKAETARANRSIAAPIVAFIVGAALSGGFVWSRYNGPAMAEKGDYNGDGKTDEQYIYSGSRLVRIETDRNFDGDVDCLYEYGTDGLLKSASLDDDFDGRMETTIAYGNEQPLEQRTDYDGDGSADVVATYVFGALQTYDYMNADGSRVRRITYNGSKADRAELDLDADGHVERRYRFDKYDEPVGESVEK